MYCAKSLKKVVTRWTLAAVLLPAVVAGCARPVGTVSGKVTFQNRPLPAGSVTFIHADGTTVSGSIQDGSYSVSKVPTGACTVLVAALPPPRSMWNPEKKETVGDSAANTIRQAMPIPPRYNDPKQSDLHYEVKGGSSQTYNIDLKP